MEAKLRQAYGAWPKGPALKEEKIEFTPAKPGYYLVQKDDVNQSSIDMVELGIRRDNPDYYAVRVFNEAFGGGFSSRLFRTIRTERVWPTRWAAALEPPSIIPAWSAWSWAPRAAPRWNPSRPWTNRSTIWPSIPLPTPKSSWPRMPF